MEKNLKTFIEKLFNEYDNIELYNLIGSSLYSEIFEQYKNEDKYDELIDLFEDANYEIDINYYDNKLKYGYEKGTEMYVQEIEEMKKEALKIFED